MLNVAENDGISDGFEIALPFRAGDFLGYNRNKIKLRLLATFLSKSMNVLYITKLFLFVCLVLAPAVSINAREGKVV